MGQLHPPTLSARAEYLYGTTVPSDAETDDILSSVIRSASSSDSASGSATASISAITMEQIVPPFVADAATLGTPQSVLDNEPSFPYQSLEPTQCKTLPRDKKERDTIARVLKDVFSVVEERPEDRWAREFLLDQSPQGAVQMLTNAAALPHAVTARLSDTLHESDGAHNGFFDTLVSLEGMYVPAFSSGRLSVGVIVDHVKCHTGNPLSPCARNNVVQENASDVTDVTASTCTNYSIGRYVRDTQDGRLLFVKHVDPSSHGPPTQTIICYMDARSCTRHERVNIFCDGPKFKEGKIVDSVLLCLKSKDSRFCPMCNAPPNARCKCIMPIYQPTHAFDFNGNRDGMKRFTGEYLGTTSAIAAMPNGLGSPIFSTADQVYASASLVTNLRVDGFQACDSEHDAVASILKSFAVQLSIADSSYVRPFISEPALLTSGSEQGAEGRKRRRPIHSTSVALDRLSDMEVILCTERNAQELVKPFRNVHANLISGVDADMTFGVPVDNAADALCNAKEDGSSPSTSQEQDDQEHDDRAARELRRRERNREAAARSNARRKARNESLKKHLADGRQAVSELRRKETRLREENLTLRRRLNSLRADGAIGLIF